MDEWKIVAQVGSVIKNTNTWIVHLAKNKFKKDYTTGESSKLYTVWFTCVCFFELSISTGDTVFAAGEFIESKNPNFPYIMKINNIGVIKKREKSNEGFDPEAYKNDIHYKFDPDEESYQAYIETV